MRLSLLITATLLAACGRPDVVAEEEQNAAALPEPANKATPTPTGGAPRNAIRSSPSPQRAAAAIPAALHGRWGLTPADCDSPLGDAKGLLVVSADELRFYESRAVPAASVERTANSISGEFSFTGEGEQWTKRERLELRDDRLVRTERESGASFRYVRCK